MKKLYSCCFVITGNNIRLAASMESIKTVYLFTCQYGCDNSAPWLDTIISVKIHRASPQSTFIIFNHMHTFYLVFFLFKSENILLTHYPKQICSLISWNLSSQTLIIWVNNIYLGRLLLKIAAWYTKYNVRYCKAKCAIMVFIYVPSTVELPISTSNMISIKHLVG